MGTMFDVVHRVASHLNLVIEGTATGGSTTTLIDTNRLDEYVEDVFDEGTCFIVYDSAGAGAAPEGEWGEVSNFNPATQTLTFSNTLTAGVASGDIYKLARARFSIQEMVSAVNRALDEVGDVVTVDSSTTVAAAQTEYTLPASDITVLKVEYNTVVNDANNLQLVEVAHQHVRKTASGSADTLIIPAQLPVGRTLYITYLGKHPNRYTSAGVIDERQDVSALSLRAAIILLEDKIFESDPDPQIKDQMEVLQQRYAEARSQQPRPPVRRRKLWTDHLGRSKLTDDLRWPG